MPRQVRVDRRAVAGLAGRQDQVVARSQLLDLGATTDWISRQVEGGRWLRLFPGVYLTHTGQPPWRSTARAALLYAGAYAALSHRSAAFRHGLVDRPGRVIEVVVPHGRRVLRQPGLIVRRRRIMPRAGGVLRAINRVDTALDVADLTTTSEDDVVALLSRLVRRPADGDEVLRCAAARPRLRHRALVVEMLGHVREGVESPLELRYRRTERRHGLPSSVLQVREVLDGLSLRADCRYAGLGIRVELDGRLYHAGKTDADVWRDNLVGLSTGELTLRYRWFHLVVDPCAVARQVVLALRSRGWTGRPRACSPGCPLADLVRT